MAEDGIARSTAGARGMPDASMIIHANFSTETAHSLAPFNALYQTMDFANGDGTHDLTAVVDDHPNHVDDLSTDIKPKDEKRTLSSVGDLTGYQNFDLPLTLEQKTVVAQFHSNLQVLTTLKQHMYDAIPIMSKANCEDMLAMKDFALDLLPHVAILPTGASEELASHVTTLCNEAQYAVRRIERCYLALVAPAAPPSPATDPSSTNRDHLRRAARKNQLLDELARLDEQYLEASKNLKVAQKDLQLRQDQLEQANDAFKGFNDTVVKELGYDVHTLRVEAKRRNTPVPTALQPQVKKLTEKGMSLSCNSSS